MEINILKWLVKFEEFIKDIKDRIFKYIHGRGQRKLFKGNTIFISKQSNRRI